jgi:hypothetical protein
LISGQEEIAMALSRPRAVAAPVEPLEGRTLLSAALAHPDPSANWHARATAVARPAIIVLPVALAPTGVTLHEVAGVPFTAPVGSFTAATNATGLHAAIMWGDGTPASDGKIVAASPTSSTATTRYSVVGTHIYASAGTFPITAVVTQSLGPPGSAAPVRLVAVIHSSAIVTPAKSNVKLDGTITGTYSLAPTSVLLGALYLFNGTGPAGDMGPVQATGRVQLPPPILTTPQILTSTGRFATGTLTLTSISASPLPGGSVTLQLISPSPVASSGPFPKVLNYTVTGGTGAFAGATGSGTIDVALDPTGLKFTFTIHSA